MEEIKKIKKVVEKSQAISLFPSPDFRKDSFPASLALFYSLKKLGKNVNLLSRDYPKRFSFLIKKEEVNFPEADFLISIKQVNTKISQLFYEKREDGLVLYLKTNGETLKKENIDIQPLDLGNLLLTLGVEDLKKVKKFLRKEPKFLINIDNQLDNKNYGDLNLVELSVSSLSEIVFDIISTIDKNLFDEKISNCLLAGILQGTSNFQNPKLSDQTFQKVSLLIEKGGDFKRITSQLYGGWGASSLRLFGRVLEKVNLSEDKELAWVVLTKKDFSEVEASPLDLRFTLEKLSSSLFPFKNFLVLWEGSNSPSLTRGVFYGPGKKIIEKILTRFTGEQKGDGVLFTAEESEPQKVKDEIINLI